MDNGCILSESGFQLTRWLVDMSMVSTQLVCLPRKFIDNIQ
jgi:hypothetical protein